MNNSFLSGVAGGATVGIVIKAYDEFSSVFKKSTTNIEKLGKLATTAALAMGAAFAYSAVNAAKFEQTTIAFNTLLGSTAKATSFLKELTDFAAKTPFELVGVETSAKQLLAVGFEAEEVLPILKSVGDVASGLGMGQDGLQRLIINLGQVRNQAKLTGRELRDFSVNGVPLLDELARSLGKTTQEIQEMVSAGKISSEMVIDAFDSMSSEGGKFANLMEKEMGSAIGKISNLKDAIEIASRSFGEIMLPAVKKVAEVIADMVTKFNELPEASRKAISTGALVGTGAMGALAVYAKLRGQTPATPMYVQNVGLGGIGGAKAMGGVGATTGAAGTAGTALLASPLFIAAVVSAVAAGLAYLAARAINLNTKDMGFVPNEVPGVTNEDIMKLYLSGTKGQGTTPMKIVTDTLWDDYLNKKDEITDATTKSIWEEEQRILQLQLQKEELESLSIAEKKYQEDTIELEKSFDSGSISASEYAMQQYKLDNTIKDTRMGFTLLDDDLKRLAQTAASVASQGSSGSDNNIQAIAAAIATGNPTHVSSGIIARLKDAGLWDSIKWNVITDDNGRYDDFISRPGMGAQSFSPQDTIIGVKNPGSLGGTNININIENLSGLDADTIATALQEQLSTMIS